MNPKIDKTAVPCILASLMANCTLLSYDGLFHGGKLPGVRRFPQMRTRKTPVKALKFAENMYPNSLSLSSLFRAHCSPVRTSLFLSGASQVMMDRFILNKNWRAGRFLGVDWLYVH